MFMRSFSNMKIFFEISKSLTGFASGLQDSKTFLQPGSLDRNG